MHVTLVHVHVTPEHTEDFIAATRANHEASVKEPGNLRFDVLQSPENPGYFVLRDAASHKQTAHYQSWRETVADWMAEPRQGIPFVALYPAFE